MPVSTMGPEQLIEALINNITSKRNHPTMIWSEPGCGKSDCVLESAQIANYKVIDLRLGLLGQLDLMGVPFRNPKTNEAEWSHPAILPRDGDLEGYDGGVLFLDEITIASKAVQGAALQLIWNRRLGEYRLPDGWVIIAAGNGQEQNAAANEMIEPLMSRMYHIYLEVEVSAWLKWAQEKVGGVQRIHPMVTKLITINPDSLIDQGAIKMSNQPIANPRAWAIASDIIRDYTDDVVRSTKGNTEAKTRMAMKHYLFSPMINTLVEGAVGVDGATQLKAICSTLIDGNIDIVEPNQLLSMVMESSPTEMGSYFDVLQEAQNDIIGSYIESIVSYIHSYIKKYMNQDVSKREKNINSITYLTAGIAVALNSGKKVRPEAKQVFISKVKDRLMPYYESYTTDVKTMEALNNGIIALSAVGTWDNL